MKAFLRWLLRALYKVEVSGLENLEAAGKRVLIVANHTSFLDAPLLALFLPGPVTFAIDTYIAKKAWMKPFLAITKVFPLDPVNPLSIKSLINYVKDDNKAIIFPEGRITVTGTLMKIYDGPGMVADKADAMVVPVRIDGALYTPFSHMRGRVPLRWFPRITLTILPAQKIHPSVEIRGRARRQHAGKKLSHIMTEMMFATSNYKVTLFKAMLNARNVHGGKHKVIEDIERKPYTYNKVIAASFILGEKLAPLARQGEYVGLLLPSACGTAISFMALQAFGRVPAMLNFTAGARGLILACETAQLKTVITSRRFIKLGKLDAVAESLAGKVQLVYLEDIASQVSTLDKLRGAVKGMFAESRYRKNCPGCTADSPAVVLFTSGSEGAPKGVVLSHANLMANYTQLAVCVDFSSRDIILNALPLFHSFGLTAGTLLPLLGGMKAFFYPSPLHYRIVPEIAYDINATVMFGTNTFLKGYARFAHPYDFYSMRYVYAGAEKLQEETRRIWAEKFGVRIFEGYGATETSPVIAANTPIYNRTGSVGQILPGMEHRLQDVAGIENGGRLFVKGPNVMLGYLLNDNPGQLVPTESEFGKGWYDTGDIVELDENNYVHIRGRAKRFAKIAGEMVSLTATEQLASKVWPDALHAVVAIADQSKGEQLVLVTEHADPQRSELLEYGRANGIGELNIPKKFVNVEKLPLLGTGKTDYPGIQKLAEESVT